MSDTAAAPEQKTASPTEDKQTKPDLDPELEKQMREAAEAEDTLASEMKDKCRQEFDKRASVISDEYNVMFNNQMSNVANRYTAHTHDRITNKQTDVLRTNKIFREVSRDLGADWKPVFERLTAGQDEKKIKVEMARIERQKPFMQPFKALNTWKDVAEDKFDIRLLVEALCSVDRRDLAEKALDILDNNEIDRLYESDSVGKGIAGGAAKLTKPETSDQSEDGGAADGTAEKPKPKAPPKVQEDPIGDRFLLKVAKAFDKEWLPLAKALEINEEEIQETQEISGDSYHGGFKCLYSWRDNMIENGKSTNESADILREVLKKLEKKDLADSIVSS